MKLTKSQKKVLESHTHSFNKYSRRDVMGLGLKAFVGYTLANTFWGWRNLALAAPSTMPAFLVFDLVGGAALPANFLVGGTGGPEDLLSNYDLLGFDPTKASLDDRFGLPAPKNTSRLFEGMIAQMSSAAQKNLRLASIAHQGADDTDINTTSALGLIGEYMRQNQLFKQKGLGSNGTNSGGRTKLSLDIPAIRPEALTNITQLNLLTGLGYIKSSGVTTADLNQFTEQQKELYMKQVADMAGLQQKKLYDQLDEMFDGYVASNKNSVELDPRNLSSTQSIFNINSNTQETNETVLSAGIANACITGFVGPSCIALGGYDYHDGTQTTGDQKDEEAGIMIGRCVELAHQLQRPFFFQILTDGSCSAKQGTRRWSADSGERSMTIMGYYDPSGPANLIKKQVGHYTNGQIAEISNYAGNKTSHVANVVFLNYLALMGKEGDIGKLVSDMSDKVIKDSIVFQPA